MRLFRSSISGRTDAAADGIRDARLGGDLSMAEFEYKFVRIGESRLSAVFGVQDRARKTYETVIQEHAQDGWRLVQVFAPGVAAFGAAKYYELILERERAANGTAPSATR
jgi:hypothetical protein